MDSPADRAALATANYVEAFVALSGALPDGSVVRDEGLVLTSIGMPVGFFNCAFVVAPPADAGRVVERCATHYGGLDLPYSVRVPREWSDGIAAAATGAGLVEGRRAPSMVLSPIPDPLPAPPPGLAIVEATDPEALARNIDALAAGFEAPVEVFRMIFEPVFSNSHRFVAMNGVVAGEVVSVAAAVDGPGSLGVYNVATPPAHRGRGYGEAVTWAAVALASRFGHTAATLQASEMGEPIYRRMGFETVREFRQFTPA